MMSKSYSNLLDLAEGNFPPVVRRGGSGGRRRLSRVMTVPGNVSELVDEELEESVSSDVPSSDSQGRVIVVSNQLPIRSRRRTGGGWSFSWDEESLILQLKDGLPDDKEVTYVGSLLADVEPADQDEVAATLLDRFRCVPAFLPADVLHKFYSGFCKQHLWPLFHYMLPIPTATAGFAAGRFDRSLWEAYVFANKLFSQKVIEVLNPDEDYIWIHDYHLLALPSFLRRRVNEVRIGFFLHSPFPSSEIYLTLPVREEILKSLLNCDLIGFHTFDYARHFLSCCCRMLGLKYQSRRGYIGLEYFGRTVGIKIMPSGVHMGQLESTLNQPDSQSCVNDLLRRFEGKTVILGVDDMDVFKGINLKLLAFEQMLCVHEKWQGRAVLVQITNPARSKGKEINDIRDEITETCHRINSVYGWEDYSPVVFIDRPVSLAERIAFYTIADCLVVTAIRDGLNLTPYEYVVCRQGVGRSNTGLEVGAGTRNSALVISEFIGCSPSLSGAIRVNPWNIEKTGEAINEAISMSENEKQLRHEKHYRYVSTHNVAYWARSFMQDLERACKDHLTKRCWGIGLGFGFRVVFLDPNFRKLHVDDIVLAYEKASSRAILLDYDGTLVSQTAINKIPSVEVTSIINTLCMDTKNVVFIVSGRGRDSLGKWFCQCEKLGIAAEHGYFMRWKQNEQWEIYSTGRDFAWMEMTEPVLKHYTEATDGSYIEKKESALVWHHQDADMGFGSAQAKELLDHLESVLANEPVVVKSGHFIVEVKPQGVSKGSVAEKILVNMAEHGKQADFVLCIGDDRSDEDMFECISGIMGRDLVGSSTSIYACTVGQKPSKAKYYLDDPNDVINMLQALADASSQSLAQLSSHTESRSETPSIETSLSALETSINPS